MAMFSFTRLRVGLALALLLMLSHGQAFSRTKIGLDLMLGTGVPFNKWLNIKGNEFEHSIKNSVGANLVITLMLNNWELRYGMNHFTTKGGYLRVPQSVADEITDVFRQLDPNYGTFPAEQSLENNQGFFLHTITFGYRFYFLGPKFKLYIPVATGVALMSSDILLRTRVGWNINTGIGLDYAVTHWFFVGADMRYQFTLTESELTLSNVKIVLTKKLNPFSDTVAMLHHLTIGVRLALKY